MVYLYMSVTLMHHAKAIGHSEMPFGHDTLTLVWSQVTLYWTGAQSPTGRRDLGPESPVHSQITLTLVPWVG